MSNTRTDIRKGTVLANGATVLTAKAIGHSRWIVLAEWNNEYVTWEADSPANTYWGHYFHGLVEAVRDFERRCYSGQSSILTEGAS